MSSMSCPFCTHTPTKCTDSRPHKARSDGRRHGEVTRRYQCPGCKQRFTTHEVVVIAKPGGHRGLVPFVNMAAIMREVKRATQDGFARALSGQFPEPTDEDCESCGAGPPLCEHVFSDCTMRYCFRCKADAIEAEEANDDG